MTPEDVLPLNPRDYLIMLVLAREPAHGYAIIKQAEAIGGEDVRLDPANLYRTLRRLHRDRLVVVASDTGKGDAARRRTYALTELGRSVVEAESARLARLTDVAREWRLTSGAGS